jgi:hypothetical protein
LNLRSVRTERIEHDVFPSENSVFHFHSLQDLQGFARILDTIVDTAFSIRASTSVCRTDSAQSSLVAPRPRFCGSSDILIFVVFEDLTGNCQPPIRVAFKSFWDSEWTFCEAEKNMIPSTSVLTNLWPGNQTDVREGRYHATAIIAVDSRRGQSNQ